MATETQQELTHLWEKQILPFWEKHLDHTILDRIQKRHELYFLMPTLATAGALVGFMRYGVHAISPFFYGTWFVVSTINRITYPTAKKSYKSVLVSLIFDFFFLAGGGGLAFGVFFMDEQLMVRVITAFAAILMSAVAFFITWDKSTEEMAITLSDTEIKREVVGLYVETFFKGCSFNQSETDITSSFGQLFAKGERTVVNSLTGLPVGDISGLTVTQERLVKNKDGEYRTEKTTVFSGFLVKMPKLPAPLTHEITLRRNREKAIIDLVNEPHRLELEDASFEATFDVMATNKLEAVKLFTPIVMDRLAHLSTDNIYGVYFNPVAGTHLFINAPLGVFNVEYDTRETIKRNLEAMHQLLPQVIQLSSDVMSAFDKSPA